jgi:RNA polymerase sigma-70 factor (ECF subfamily)
MASETEFTALIQEHQGLLFKVASVYTNSTLDRDDLFQEIVYQLWKSFDSFRGESKITTWMYRVGMNTAISHLKKSKRSTVTLPLTDAINLSASGLDELQEERLKLLHRYIQQLNTLEKGLMLLLLEGKSYQEIAEITGLTSSNVGTRISRIKKKLKSNMIKS